MLTRRTEEYTAQMIGLNLEIYLEIGLTLMTTTGQDLETDQ